MNWLRAVFAVTVLGLTAVPDYAIAQSLKDRLVGTWLLVSNTNTAPDGTKRQPFGESPKGVLILEANGRYAQVFTRPDRPKFKANNRLQGTPDEIKAAWEGALAHFGTWSVSEADKTVLLRVEGSFYPNQEGNEDKRVVNSLASGSPGRNGASTASGAKSASRSIVSALRRTANSSRSCSSTRRLHLRLDKNWGQRHRIKTAGGPVGSKASGGIEAPRQADPPHRCMPPSAMEL